MLPYILNSLCHDLACNAENIKAKITERSCCRDFLLIDKFNLHSCYYYHSIKEKLEIMPYRGAA